MGKAMKDNTIRDKSDANHSPAMLIMQRDKTTFLITLHFASNSQETLVDKAKRLMMKDVQNDDF